MRSLVKLWMMVLPVFFMACESDVMMDAYSKHGVEHDKNVLKSSTESLNNELEQLSQTRFAAISHSMFGRLDGHEVSGNALFLQAVVEVGELMYNNASQNCYFEELMTLTFDKDYYCSLLANEGCGVWAWDDTNSTFIKVKEHETDVVFQFPATNETPGDTALLTISDLAFYSGDFPNKGEVLEDGTVVEQALEKLHFSIKVKDELVLASNVNATFTNDGYFQVVAMTFNPTPYNLSGELGKDEQNGYWMLTFNNDTDRVLGHLLDLSFDGHDEQMPVEQLINSLAIEEVVFNTTAGTGELYNELLKVDELQPDSKAYAEALASALNSYAAMDVRYLNDNKIIAKAHAVPKARVDEAGSWWVDLELEFSDGSRESGEVYFDDFLAQFKLELEQMVAEFASKFGV
ncbi:hypothetical protein KDU71_13180 [Carboxylicivirga sediminis]|uniref:Lipoprotein n=1 Tax=Carboxylicivirga sediminis TaxID=2006564 RepID=A0A941IY12_9BACT|nr:hypothetical protein [Carboxylicivirga sediminis]MBR8536520.1 hypothetical protein [Carboxylicivirga sediminis]